MDYLSELWYIWYILMFGACWYLVHTDFYPCLYLVLMAIDAEFVWRCKSGAGVLMPVFGAEILALVYGAGGLVLVRFYAGLFWLLACFLSKVLRAECCHQLPSIHFWCFYTFEAGQLSFRHPFNTS